jgi:hypothetical protein
MPSKKANKYGTAAEYHLIDERDLQLARSSWHDAIFPSTGTPVEIKSCDMDSTGYFQIYEKYHRKLVRAGGWYGFVLYRRSGGSITVLETRLRKAAKMPLLRWSGTGGHRSSRKSKVPARDVM